MRLLRSVFVWAVWAAGSGPAAGAARVSPGDWAGGLAEYGYSAEATISMGDSYTTAFLNFSYLEDGVNRTSTSEDGKYGEGHVGDATGVVVHVRSEKNRDDHTGCHMPLVGHKNLGSPKKPWIALIKRGGCNFEDKVKHAYQSNASGVLIYNDKAQSMLDKMKLVDKSRNISAVFTFKQRGEELASLADSGIEVMLNISVGTHCVRSPSNMNRTSVLFVSISFIVLMVMSISWLVFYYIQRFRYIHAKDRLSKRLCSAAKKALSKIPVKNLKVEDKEIQGDGECCAVCIEPYKISDILRVLPCKHDFHKSCIDPWLLEHRTCPMCKMDILKYYGFVFTGSQESILQLDAEEGDRRTTGGVSPLPRQETPQQLNDIHVLLAHHGFRRPVNVLDRSHSMTYIEQIASEASRTSSYDAGHSERSSRASSPDEMTPSLSSNPSPLGLYSKFPPQSPTNEAASYEKRGIPAVHSTPSCSRQPVETTIVSEEHHREDITKDAV